MIGSRRGHPTEPAPALPRPLSTPGGDTWSLLRRQVHPDRAPLPNAAEQVRDWTDQPWIHQLIEERARLLPDAVAVRFDGASLRYAELNRRANQLAHRLIRLGVGRDVLAGISMERGFDLVVAVLAVWKAGGAYVPLDPDLPASRRALMIADTGAVVVLTHRAVRARLGEDDGPLLCVDEPAAGLAAEPADNPEVPVTGEDAAYVIYTSGSTGTPKGVVNVRAGVRNRLAWMTEKFGLGQGDRVLQKSPFTFDTSVWELFWPLTIGATLVMARPDGHRDSRYLVDVIRDEKVTFADFVPSMLEMFLREPEADQCTSLRHVIAGGEALTRTLRGRFFAVLPETRLYNLYGPTEASIGVTYWECHADDDEGRLPIGFPIANTRIYLLGAEAEQVDVGVPGEICIAGRPVARGYLNRPGLTAERFVADPFVPGERMYRTGDLGQRRVDGALEFLGRVDEQVKIRGVRIELGEVEAGLLSLTGVGQAAAAVHGHGMDRRLVAYLVPDSGALEPGALRREMATVVPDYLMPSAFVVLETLPVTAHGKVDRTALPDPGTAIAERDYQAPAGAVEETLARLWAEALGVQRVGRDDNFFALGGQSLLAMQLVNRVRSALGVQLPFRAVFETSTLAELAVRVGNLPVSPADAGPFGAEERIRKLIAEALGIDQVAADDNIFDLGGDRDTIERLTQAIEQEFGVALNPLVVAAVPTAKHLAGRVGTGPEGSPLDVMVPLRPGTGRISLFCVHPLGGLSWLFYPLVHAIPETVGVYGIQARGLRPGDTLPPSMAAMAADYINEIRAVQPEGPYHLLGLSVGGEIAHEIAVQLRHAGYEVALLAMLDSRPTPYSAGAGVERLNADAAARPARSTEEFFEELRQRQGPYAFLLRQQGRAVVDLYKNMAKLMATHTYSTYDGAVLFVEAIAGRAPDQHFAPMWRPYVTGNIEVLAVNHVHRGLARADVLEMIGARVAEVAGL